jgi:hypothetical protein
VDAPARQVFYVSLMVSVTGVIVASVLEFAPSASAAPTDDPALLTLIRGMAVIKAVLATLAGSAVAWRLGRPAGGALVLSYLAGVWLMVLGSVVVWQCVHVGWAALLFHTGELSVLVTAWRDGRKGWLRGRQSSS